MRLPQRALLVGAFETLSAIALAMELEKELDLELLENLPAEQNAAGGAVAGGEEGLVKRRATAKAKGKARRSKQAAEAHLCAVCQANPRSGNNPYCKEDKKEYEALKKDCIKNHKQDTLDKALNDIVLFRILLQDYREQCQPVKCASGWQRPPFDFSRMSEIMRKRSVSRSGGASRMVDYFDVLEMFEKKRMSQGDADLYWRKLINNPILDTDEKGLNPEFPKRVEWVETGLKEWFKENAREQVTERHTKDMKAAATDEAFENMANSMVDDDGFEHLAVGGAKRSREEEANATPKKSAKLDAAASSADGKVSPLGPPAASAAAVATGRLLAWEANQDQFKASVADLVASFKKGEKEAAVSDEDKEDFSDYLAIIGERMDLVKLIFGKSVPDLENPKLRTFAASGDMSAEVHLLFYT